jgi:8-amino-7-oxononanoate synthase
MVVQAVRASLRLIRTESWRRERLTRLVGQLRAGLTAVRWPNPPSTTAIQPLIVGDNRACTGLMHALLAQGLRMPAIRPPTVPDGTARLRISLTAAHTPADVVRLVKALVAAAAGALDEPDSLELFRNE